MKLDNIPLHEIASRMGSSTTDAEAEAMLSLLRERGYTDTDGISDGVWFELAATAAQRVAFEEESAKLNAYLPSVVTIDGVASASIWTPSATDLADNPDWRPQLMVEAYRSARGGNPSSVQADIVTPWLELVSDGSGELGPCWAWSVARA